MAIIRDVLAHLTESNGNISPGVVNGLDVVRRRDRISSRVRCHSVGSSVGVDCLNSSSSIESFVGDQVSYDPWTVPLSVGRNQFELTNGKLTSAFTIGGRDLCKRRKQNDCDRRIVFDHVSLNVSDDKERLQWAERTRAILSKYIPWMRR